MNLLDIENIKNISNNLKSDFDNIYELSLIRKSTVNEITAKNLENNIVNLKAHINNIEIEFNKNNKKIIEIKKRKYDNLNESKSRIERKKLKKEFYSLLSDSNLKSLLYGKELYYLEYKSLLKINNLLEDELNANKIILDKYIFNLLKVIKKRNKSFNSLDPAIQEILLNDKNNVEEIAEYISERKKEILSVSHVEALKMVEYKDVYDVAKKKSMDLYENIKVNYSKIKTNVKSIKENIVEKDEKNNENLILNDISYSEGHPKIIIDVLNTALIHLKEDKSKNIKLIKDKNVLDILLEDFKIRKRYVEGHVKFKIIKFLDDSFIPVYDSDSPGVWLNESDLNVNNLKRDFMIKAYDFIDNV